MCRAVDIYRLYASTSRLHFDLHAQNDETIDHRPRYLLSCRLNYSHWPLCYARSLQLMAQYQSDYRVYRSVYDVGAAGVDGGCWCC